MLKSVKRLFLALGALSCLAFSVPATAQGDATAMADLADDSVDVVFMSNFLEHLEHKGEVLATLRESRRVLRVGGGLFF